MSKIRFVGEDQCLNTKCAKVDIDDFIKNKFKYFSLFEDLIKKVKKKGGCGIAAPQIGELVSVIVVKTDGVCRDNNGNKITVKENHPIVAINPVFENIDDEMETETEGCLSIPNRQFKINRYKRGRVNFYDLKGNKNTYIVDGFICRVFQHEIDHINGITLIEREKEIV